jgi:hypothetical protein
MAENKGKGTKGRSYDELSGVGTSKAGITGIKESLGDLRREAGLGPDLGESGSMQSADLGQSGGTPSGGPAPSQGQGQGQGQQNRQSGQSGSAMGGNPEDQQQPASSNEQGRSRS